MRLQFWKGQLIDGHAPDMVDASILAWTDLRGTATPNSPKWIEATDFLSSSLRRAGQYKASLEWVSLLLKVERSPWRLLAAAECNVVLGRDKAAESLMVECQKQVKELSASERKSEIETAKFLTLQIEKLRSKITGDAHIQKTTEP